MRVFFFLFVVGNCFYGNTQKVVMDTIFRGDSSVSKFQVYEGIPVLRNFDAKYRATLRRVKKVYPYALYAASVLDSLETQLKGVNSKAKRRRAERRVRNQLKDKFKYSIKNLYVSEGKVLTKLIYRETGMTVREIIEKYSNDISAVFYSSIADVIGQDLDAVYKPNTEDFVIECVVQDIKTGKVKFDPSFEVMDKKEYRKDMKEYRKEKRENRKEARKLRRKQRKEK